MKKYEFTGETKCFLGRTLHRIRAMRSFGKIETGELGGWIEKEDNLSHDGDAWVYGNAQISGDARIFDDARIFGNARVYSNAQIFGNARIFGNAQIFDDAQIFDNAQIYGNAQIFGNAWISGNAQIFGNARISGDAWIFGNAQIFGQRMWLLCGPLGSRNDFTTFFARADQKIGVACGCFMGDIDQFAVWVKETHGDSAFGEAYCHAIEMARAWIVLPGSEDAGRAGGKDRECG